MTSTLNISKPLQSLARELRNQSRDELNTTSLTSLMRQSLTILMTSVRARLKQDEIIFYRKLISDLFGLLVADTVLDHYILSLITSIIREISSLIDGKLPRYFNEPLATYSEKRLVYLISLLRELDSIDSESNLDFLSQIVVNNAIGLSVRLSAFSLLVSSKLDRPQYFSDIDECLAKIFTETFADNADSNPKHGLLKSIMHGIASSSLGPKPLELDGSVSNEPVFTPIHHLGNFSVDQITLLGFLSSISDYVAIRYGPKISADPPSAPPVSPTNSPVAQIAPSTFSFTHRFATSSLLDPSDRILAESLVQLSVQILAQSQREISSLVLEGRKSFRTVSVYPGTSPDGLAVTAPAVSQLKLWTREYVESVISEILRILNLLCTKDPSIASVVFPHIKRVYERVTLRPDSPGVCVCEMVRFFLNHSHLVVFDMEPVLKFFFTTHIPRLLNPKPIDGYNRASILAIETFIFLSDISPLLTSTHWSVYSRYFPSIFSLIAWYPRLVSGSLDSTNQFCTLIDDLVSKATPEILVDIFHTVCDIPLIAAVGEMSSNISDYIVVAAAATASEAAAEPAAALVAAETDEGGDQFANGRLFMRLLRSSQFKEIGDYVNRVRTSHNSNPWISPENTVVRQLLSELWQGLPLTPRVSASSRLVPLIIGKIFGSSYAYSSCIFRSILERFGSDRIFLFKQEISDLFVNFISKVVSPKLISEHRDGIVTAILQRLFANPKDELVTHLVFLMGSIKSHSEERPLFVRTLIWILTTLTGAENIVTDSDDIVYVKNGRLVKPPSNRHALLDQLETIASEIQMPPISDSQQLACITVTSLTKIGIHYPQYRPRIQAVLSRIPETPDVLRSRIAECLLLLKSYHINETLVVLRDS